MTRAVAWHLLALWLAVALLSINAVLQAHNADRLSASLASLARSTISNSESIMLVANAIRDVRETQTAPTKGTLK